MTTPERIQKYNYKFSAVFRILALFWVPVLDTMFGYKLGGDFKVQFSKKLTSFQIFIL